MGDVEQKGEILVIRKDIETDFGAKYSKNVAGMVSDFAADSTSDAVSPQTADVVDGNRLQKAPERHENTPSESFTPVKNTSNGRYKHDHGESSVGSDEHDLSEREQFNESFHDKYRGLLSENSPEIESDLDKDELTPDSPGDNSRSSIDYSRPIGISPYSSAFGVEEARLRFSLDPAQFKDRLGASQGGLSPYSDEILRRRYSVQDSLQDGSNSHSIHTKHVTSSHSSEPGSPRSSSHQTSPQSFRSPTHSSIHNISFEDQDNRNFLPRIKEGLYFCHLCSFSGSTQVDFDQHMTIHFEHICPHCDYKSRTEGRLKRHIKDFHTEDPDGGYGARTMPGRPKVFRCKQCEYSTTEKIDFWSHSRSHIKEDKLLQCPRCPFVTEYKHHLEYHLRNHFGSKPFKCPKCNYACVNKSMLNSHMKSHTNVYQYRCADCTYATKYCHSLKLHLRKYNHKPAAVLNSDGSLPQGVDATASGLSLLAKRGPPRGPRGPRKDKMEPGPSNFLPMPPSPLGPIPGLPGMMSPFWPMLHNQMQAGRMPHPLSFNPRFNAHLAGLSPLGIKSEDMKSPPYSLSSSITSTTSSNQFKCNFCSFIGTSREVLTSHVMKVHAMENQDLFSMFGLSSESLLDDGKKRMAAALASVSNPTSKSPRFDLFGGHNPEALLNIKKENGDKFIEKMPKEFDRMKSSPYAFMNSKFHSDGNMKDEGIDILKQMTLKFGSGPVDLKRKLPPTSLSMPITSLPSSSAMMGMSQSLSDAPLDLTKPRSPPEFPPNIRQYPVAEDTGDQFKMEDEDQSSGENSVYSNNDVASPPPRKRSRKGKAFKLDTLCMKLQEKQGNMYESEEESTGEIDEMYRSDLLPIEADEMLQEEINGKDCNDNEEEDEERKSHKENSEKEVEFESGKENSNMGTGNINTDEKIKGILEEDLKQLQAKIRNPESSDMRMKKLIQEAVEDERGIKDGEDEEEHVSSSNVSDEQKPSTPPGFPNQNRRKPIAAAIQRGADIAWKILNAPHISDPSLFIKNGNNGHKLEMTPLDKKLWFEAPECTSHTQKTDKGEYECPHCQISFGDCIMYTMHMGYHGYKDPYKCNMCGDTCKDRVEFFLHIARAAHN